MENSLIYVPDKDSYECFIVRDSDTIRAYRTLPTNDNISSYRDYYVNSHYLYNDDSEYFSSSDIIPTCIDTNLLTTQYSYRNDFADICIIALIIGFVCFYFVSTVVKSLFKGRKFF